MVDLDRLKYEAFMSQKPMAYRDFTVCPTGFAAPYYIRGETVFWGYNVCSTDSHTNMSPGGVWFRTVEQAMGAIDCIHDANGAADPLNKSNWSTTYWRLMEERGHYGSAERENRPGWTPMQWRLMRSLADRPDGTRADLTGFHLLQMSELQVSGVVRIEADRVLITELGRRTLRGRENSIEF